MKKKKGRKPRASEFGPLSIRVYADADNGSARFALDNPWQSGSLILNASRARRLAAWLLKFAEWAEGKG